MNKQLENLVSAVEELVEALPALRDCDGNQPLYQIEDLRDALIAIYGPDEAGDMPNATLETIARILETSKEHA